MKNFIKKNKWIVLVGILAIATTIFLSIFLVKQHTRTRLNTSVALGDHFLSELNYGQAIISYTQALDIDKKYPVVETADYSNMALETVKNGQISCSYPADGWVASEEIPSQLQIFWEKTIGTGQAVNININLTSTSKVLANYDWVADMLSQLEDDALEGFAITVESIEPRLLNGEAVVYAELVTQITDEMIDLMIERGVYTEEQIEAAGGREVILSIPPTTQISITAEQDGYLYTCTGTYYKQEQKQMVLDTMAIVIGTVEKQ